MTLYNLAMGSNIDVDDLMTAGERIHTMQKLFNIKHRGFSREEDVLQDRMFEVPPNQHNTKIGLDRENGRSCPMTISPCTAGM